MNARHLQCPACGSDRLHWELHRAATRNFRVTAKVLHWSCRACGLTWQTAARIPHVETPLGESQQSPGPPSSSSPQDPVRPRSSPDPPAVP